MLGLFQPNQKTGVQKTDPQLEWAGKLSEMEKTLRDMVGEAFSFFFKQ